MAYLNLRSPLRVFSLRRLGAPSYSCKRHMAAVDVRVSRIQKRTFARTQSATIRMSPAASAVWGTATALARGAHLSARLQHPSAWLQVRFRSNAQHEAGHPRPVPRRRVDPLGLCWQHGAEY